MLLYFYIVNYCESLTHSVTHPFICSLIHPSTILGFINVSYTQFYYFIVHAYLYLYNIRHTWLKSPLHSSLFKQLSQNGSQWKSAKPEVVYGLVKVAIADLQVGSYVHTHPKELYFSGIYRYIHPLLWSICVHLWWVWPNGEKLASNCMRIWARPKPTQICTSCHTQVGGQTKCKLQICVDLWVCLARVLQYVVCQPQFICKPNSFVLFQGQHGLSHCGMCCGWQIYHL